MPRGVAEAVQAMKVRVEYVAEVSDEYRRAIAAHYTGNTFRPGLATRAQVADWFREHGTAGEVRLKELAEQVAEDTARCYPLRRGTVLIPNRSVLKVRGQRGAEFVYQTWKSSRDGDVLTVVGGKAGHKLIRSFRADQVTKVRRVASSRPGARAVG